MSAADVEDPKRQLKLPIVQGRKTARRFAAAAASRRWWSARDAAEYVGSGPKEIYKAVSAGKLKAVRLNRRGDIRTTREWIDEWMDQKRCDGLDPDASCAAETP